MIHFPLGKSWVIFSDLSCMHKQIVANRWHGKQPKIDTHRIQFYIVSTAGWKQQLCSCSRKSNIFREYQKTKQKKKICCLCPKKCIVREKERNFKRLDGVALQKQLAPWSSAPSIDLGATEVELQELNTDMGCSLVELIYVLWIKELN